MSASGSLMLFLFSFGFSEAGILKAELETALDEHLSSNKDIFSGDKRFADYYRRLSQPSRLSSPVKKEPKTDAIASGDDIKKSARRRTTKAKEESDVTYVFLFS